MNLGAIFCSLETSWGSIGIKPDSNLIHFKKMAHCEEQQNPSRNNGHYWQNIFVHIYMCHVFQRNTTHVVSFFVQVSHIYLLCKCTMRSPYMAAETSLFPVLSSHTAVIKLWPRRFFATLRQQKCHTGNPWLTGIPYRGLTYPTLGKGKSSSKCHLYGCLYGCFLK